MFGIRRSAFTVLFGLFILAPVFAYGGLVKGRVTGVPANTSFSINDSNGKEIHKTPSVTPSIRATISETSRTYL